MRYGEKRAASCRKQSCSALGTNNLLRKRRASGGSGSTVAARFILLLAPIAGLTDSSVAATLPAHLFLGHFSQGHLDGWAKKEFAGETRYVIDQIEGNSVLKASSRSSASGLVKRQRIDLQKYPFLNWRWKISNRLPPRDETTKSGDDYPVRVYVVVDGGPLFWRTKSLNYVWSRDTDKGSTWANAFAKRNVVMLSLRDRRDATGVWHEEKRNVLEDIRRYLGSDIPYIASVAIMTDTDNTASSVESFYGDIYFSTR